MADIRRLQLADEMLRRFAAALRAAQLYAPDHPLLAHNITALAEALGLVHGYLPAVSIGLVGEEIVVGDAPMPRSGQAVAGVMRQIRRQGVECVTIHRGVSPEEIARLVALFAGEARRGSQAAATDLLQYHRLHADDFPHIALRGLHVEKRLEVTTSDVATVRQVYTQAVGGAETIWQDAQARHLADPTVLRDVVNNLAQAVAQNRTVLLALTALKNYDNYTFTHMVNVSILSMAQARTLGIDGLLLREIGLAGMMHDIGKVRTPPEILNKAGKLTDEELVVMRRHPVDGAAILRRTPDIPLLAPLVAFEHHLRLDGSGYPPRVERPTLNLATQVCMIADVYDAMRSKRRYQQAFPTDRVLAVLRAENHSRFDRHLVRRFVQLLGFYPPGNLVRLDTGEIAIVVGAHAGDPYRPRVRLLFGPDGSRYADGPLVDLWTASPASGRASAVVCPVDADEVGVDPLACL